MHPHQDQSETGRSQEGGKTEEHSFDGLAKGLASGAITRRQALRGIGFALFGGVLASIPGLAWAKPKPGKCTKNDHCPPGQNCVNGTCSPAQPGACVRDRDCASPEDLCCNGVCTNVVFDRNNCGACGTVCPEGYICQGSCIPSA